MNFYRDIVVIKYPGLAFQKFDLHVHTPASQDFEPKSVTAKQIVEKAIERGLKGIAITDHNTGAGIDSSKQEAKKTDLVVLPGVEIYCTGGKSGIHIIAILDVDKGIEHVNALLATLKFKVEDFGKTRRRLL